MKPVYRTLLVVLLLGFLLAFVTVDSTSTFAKVPDFITYSGRITDGSYDGLSAQATITFRLFDDAEGGAMLWEHEETVVVQDGYFSVMLSEGTANDQPKTITTVFAEHGETWMELEVGGQVLAREEVGSVPYSVHSSTADAVLQIEPGGVRNLRVVKEGGEVRVTSQSGKALDADNPGWVSLPSNNDVGAWITLPVLQDVIFNDADSDSSDLVGWDFGTHPDRIWDEELPLFLYSVNTNDTPAGIYFGLTRSPAAQTTPTMEQIGYLGTPAQQSSQHTFIILSADSDADVSSKPLALVGAVLARKPQAYPSDWLIWAPEHHLGFGRPSLEYVAGRHYKYPPEQASHPKSFLHSGTGNIPYWTSVDGLVYHYTISLDGWVRINVSTGGAGNCIQNEDAEGHTVLLMLPYVMSEFQYTAPWIQSGLVKVNNVSSQLYLAGANGQQYVQLGMPVAGNVEDIKDNQLCGNVADDIYVSGFSFKAF